MNTQALITPPTMTRDGVADVTLLGYKDMQTNFLSTLIRQELKRHCAIWAYHDQDAYCQVLMGQLVLLDCKYIPVSEMNTFFEEQCAEDTRVALINVQPSGSYEKLAQWPQMKGMFYETVEQNVLISGLQVLLQGGDWLPRHIMQRMIDAYRSAPRKPKHDVKLTRRERQVLTMLLDGSTNLQIAEGLDVSEYTIKSHLHNVFKKIDVKNRIQAYNWAQLHLHHD